MSHIVQLSLDIKDLDALEKAADEIGLNFTHGATRFRTYGGKQDPCLHRLSVKDNEEAYEIGVVEKDGCFGLLWDSYGGGKGLVDVVGKDANTLRQRYAVIVAEKHHRRAGHRRIRRVTQADGRIQVHAFS